MSRIFKKLIRHTAIISSGTFVSRILGFVRDILIARFFGTGFAIEAFLVAFRLPNMLRALLGEGAVDSVVIPVLSEHKDRDSFRKTCGRVLTAAFFILCLAVVLGVIFAKWIVMAAAPGFISSPDKFNLTVSVTRILFFYLLFIGLSANLGGILYTKGNFFIPSFSPLILNVVLIAGILWIAKSGNESVYWLSYFVLFAGSLQFLVHFLSAKKYFHFGGELKRAFSDKAVVKMLKLSLPRIWSVAVYHLSLFIDTLLASFSFLAGAGAIAAIYYSNRLIQFPLSLFSLSVSRAALPKLSSAASDNLMDDFKSVLYLSFENLSFFIIPFSIIMTVLPSAFIEALFKRGAFNSYSVSITSSALSFYSLGLFFFAGTRLLMSSFYALKDTKTPAKVATFALVINVVLSLILLKPLKVGGLALASSLSSLAAFVCLLRILQHRIGKVPFRVWGEILKITFAGGVMAGTAKYLWNFSFPFPGYLNLGLSLLSGAGVFLFISLLLRVKSLMRILPWVLKRK